MLITLNSKTINNCSNQKLKHVPILQKSITQTLPDRTSGGRKVLLYHWRPSDEWTLSRIRVQHRHHRRGGLQGWTETIHSRLKILQFSYVCVCITVHCSVIGFNKNPWTMLLCWADRQWYCRNGCHSASPSISPSDRSGMANSSSFRSGASPWWRLTRL